MRTKLIYALLIATNCAQAQFGYDHAIFEETTCGARHHWQGVPKNGGPPTRGYDMKYVRAAWSVDPAVRAISGTVTSHFVATDLLNEVVMDLSDTLLLDGVMYHGNGIAATLSLGDVLTIPLPQQLSIGTLDSLTISYHGVPRTTGFGSFGTGEQNNGSPTLWTLSEPFGAKDWWPCKQDLNDKIDSVDLYVTTPSTYRVGSNGRLVSEVVNGPNTTYYWKSRYPIAYYLISLAVADYIVFTRDIIIGEDTIPMLTYSWDTNPTMAELNAGDAAQQMGLYSELFGLYPFAKEKYGHAQFGWGGGMEHQTMTSMGGWSFELSAHELAHQWFGDKVTCGRWEDIWLNEGFATYLQGMVYEFQTPEYWQGYLQSKINSVISAPDGSVLCTDPTNVNRVFSGRLTYNKGAMVLHMLRWVSGNEAWFQGIRNYLNDPALAYGSAITSDLQAHLEATSGVDLDGFMADWFTGEGYPTYTMPWTQNENGTVQLSLYQSPSHSSVDFFEMPVPVRFKNADMDSTVVFDHLYSGQSFTMDLPFQADSAILNPDRWIVTGQNIVTRVNELSAEKDQLVIFPNPATESIQLRGLGKWKGNVDVTITDGAGRVVVLSANTSLNDGLILIHDLPAGCYTLKATGSDAEIRMPFIKQ
ncbi:MAG: T9SS type A sorting domain-containing protein [Flavobacteriales bacterium]|nr:T9SS type A sorting domain-containing protein [Flavobacteriales bacterium]